MKRYGNTIGEGKACIVVRAQGLDQLDHVFWKWLHDEGFTMWPNHGHYDGCDWVFINLNSMVYAPGMPGIKVASPIRDLNGISIEEFKTIWNIYKYREVHPVRDEYKKAASITTGIVPAVPKDAHICHIFEFEDAKAAGKDLEMEPVKGYGASTYYKGIELHSNHEMEGGGRALVRCKKCGALLLSQHTWYESINPDLDGSFYDWIPVWSEKEADLLNIFLDGHELPNHPFRHLRSNNGKYCWIGKEQPHPMDLPELSNAVAMKYEKEIMTPSEEDYEDNSPINEDVWQEILKNLPQAKEIAEAILNGSFGKAKAWCLQLDETDDEELQQIHVIAVFIDAMMRSDDIGFTNTHLVFTNDPEQDEVTWERTEDGYAIHLCAESAANWCQVIWQIGYAMMHCLIDHLNPDRKKAICWAEELICEASAIEILTQFVNNWDETPLCHRDPEYSTTIAEYLDKMLADRGTSALLRCKDKYALSQLNIQGTFNDRMNESHDLYYRMRGVDLVELARVREYAIDTLLINTHYWIKQTPVAAVDYLCRLQESIPGCDVPPGIALMVDLRSRRPDIDETQQYESKIRHLRDIPDEWILFRFIDPDDKTQKGVCSYQICIDHDDMLCTEVTIRNDEGEKVYVRKSTDDEAASIMHRTLNGIDFMDLPGWVDVTGR